MEKYYAIAITNPIVKGSGSDAIYIKTTGEIIEGIHMNNSGCVVPIVKAGKIKVSEISKEFYESQKKSLEGKIVE